MKKIKVEKTSSKGIVMGKVFLVKEQDLNPKSGSISKAQADGEKNQYEMAVEEVKSDLRPLAETSDIFAAHLELVQDISLKEGVLEKISTGLCNAEQALHNTVEEFQMIFESMEDEYMRERAADLVDIRNRLMRKLKGIGERDFDGIHKKVILVAKDLTPSDTSKLNTDYILGFITELGGVTSHVSIMARGLGIPALVGVQGFLQEVKADDLVIMDAGTGDIFINPNQETIEFYNAKAKELATSEKEMQKAAHLPTITKDGRTLEVYANVGNLDDVKNAVSHKIDGVGLFRSEFLYMEKDHFPTEEEQFIVYKEAAEMMAGKELTIRTLDIGGDKGLDYFEFPKEENPFLGYRAIRIGLDREEILKTQLRALLRASAYGNIRIMYPMIISVEELKKANAILQNCMQELKEEGISYSGEVKTGVMIETPAAVMIAEELAEIADFFSIGTNDLTQYFLAVDRGNQKISVLYNSFHPAVLRAIDKTIKSGHKKGRKVGMCGEFASDVWATEMLLGMGLDEFSMAAGETAGIKFKLRNCSYEKAKELSDKVLAVGTVAEVMDILAEPKDAGTERKN